MRFGQHLQAARVRSHMTQTQAAEFSGLDRSQISDLERGQADGVHLKTLLKLGKTYGVTIDELIGYQPLPEPRMNERERRAVNLLLSVMRDNL